MAELDRIKLALAVDSSQWATGLSGAASALTGFGGNVDSTMTRITSKLTKASTLFSAFGIGIGIALGASIGPAMAFETAFTGVLKTVDGTPAQLKAVRDGILDLASSMPAAATEIAGVAEAAGQLGISTDGVVKFSETMVQLGETTNLSAEEAATALARFSNIMGTSEADIGRLGATIVGLGNNAATTEAEIVSWGLRLAGAGKVAGLTEAEVLGIGAALSSVGIAAEAGGTAVSQVIFDITKAVESGSPKLETYGDIVGMTGEAFATMWESDPTGALLAFVEGLAAVEAEGGSAVVALDQLGLDGARLSRVLLSAAGAGDLLADNVNRASGEFAAGSALVDEYGKFADTTASKLKVMAGQLEILAINAGTPMLDGLVAGAEAATQGIQFLSEAFGPAAAEIAEFVGAMVDAGAAVTAALGAPVLGAAAAALVGFAAGVEILFSGLNAIPGAAEAAATALAIFLLATRTTVFASIGASIAALAINLAVIGPAATAGAAGMSLLSAAASPLVLVTGAAIAVGKSLIDARKAAEEAATAFESRLNKALDAGNMAAYAAAVDDVAGRMRELQEIDKVSDGLGGGWESWGTALKSVGQILTPFTENTVVNARAELEALDETMQRTRADKLSAGIQSIADTLGITTDKALATATELGILDQVTARSAQSFHDYGYAINEPLEAVRGFITAEDELARSLGLTSDKFKAHAEIMSSGAGTYADVADALGVTSAALGFLMDQAGVTESDLLDPEKWAASEAAVRTVQVAYNELAREIGQTGSQLTTTLGEILGLGAAWDDLASSVSGYQTALDALNNADAGFALATAELEAQAKAFDGTQASAQSYAEAIRASVLAYAATGASTQEVIAYQQQLADGFITAGLAAGMTRSEIDALLVSFGLVPEEVIVDIVAKAEGVVEEAERIRALLGELTESQWIAEIAAETGTAESDIRLAYTILEDWDQTVAVAVLAAETGVAIEDLATLVALGADWETTVAVATFLAEGDDAQTVLSKLAADGATWDQLVAVATLLAQDDASVTVEDLLAELGDLDGNEWIADLLAKVEGLDDVEALREAIASLQDKTVRVTVNGSTYSAAPSTYTPTTNYSGRSADGNLYFANGGIAGPIAERSGAAKLYSPTPRYRIHSEPETGGEAYIPLAPHKRGRSVPLWRETGRRLGQFADGGILGRFASGGITGQTSGSFLDTVGIPIRVDVEVNGRGIGQLDAALSGVAKSIDSVGKAGSAAGGEIARGFDTARIAAINFPAGFVESFGSAEELMARFGLTIEELEQTFGTVGGSATEAGDQAATAAERMFDAFNRAGIGIAEVARESGRALLEAMDPSVFLATMERISGWAASDLGNVLAGFEGSVAETIAWIEDAGLTMEDVFRTVFLEASDDIDVMVGALGLLEEKMSDTADASRLLDDALNFLTGQQRGLLEAQLDAVQAVERFTDAMEKEGATIDKTTAAGARNYEQLLKTGDALRGVVVKVAESGAGMEATQAAYDNAVGTFRDVASAAGLSADEIDGLVKILFTMPESIVTEVVVNGIEQKEAAQALFDALVELDGFLANPEIVLDDDSAAEDLAEILNTLEELGYTDAVVTVDADTGVASIDLQAVIDLIADIEEERATAGVDADTADADAALAALGELLLGFTSEEWQALLGADDQASPVIAVPAKAAVTYAESPYDASVTATDTNATATFGSATTAGNTFKDAPYDAKATGSDVTASLTFRSAGQVGRTFADDTYLGKATGTDVNATSTFKSAAGAGRAFAITYTATLRAIDQASGIIGNVASAARGVVGTYTATIRTINEVINRVSTVATGVAGGSNVPANVRAFGGITYPGGYRAMSRGGMIAPAGSNILWAEDETGGESYIPWALDRRRRATDILEQTAEGFGYGLHPLAPGYGYGPGAQGPTVVVAPGAVAIDITAPAGVDPREFARIAEAAVARGLDRFTREVALAGR